MMLYGITMGVPLPPPIVSFPPFWVILGKKVQTIPVQSIRCWPWSVDCWEQHQNIVGKDETGRTLWAVQTVHRRRLCTPSSEENVNPSESGRAIPGRSPWKLSLVNAEGDSPSHGGTRRLQEQPSDSGLRTLSLQSKNRNNNQPHGGQSKQVATHREENMNYHRRKKKKQYLNDILPRIQKKLVQMCLTSSGFKKIREKFTRGGLTHMKISQCWVRKGKLKTLQQN